MDVIFDNDNVAVSKGYTLEECEENRKLNEECAMDILYNVAHYEDKELKNVMQETCDKYTTERVSYVLAAESYRRYKDFEPNDPFDFEKPFIAQWAKFKLKDKDFQTDNFANNIFEYLESDSDGASARLIDSVAYDFSIHDDSKYHYFQRPEIMFDIFKDKAEIEKQLENYTGEHYCPAEYSDKDEEAEIVESNDGYVMGMSKVTPANESKLYSKIEHGNEVVHNETPRETTNTIADIRPNVKYEACNDVGSKEKSEIDSGFGTDNDIDALARQAKSYKSQSDSYDIDR